MSNRRDGVEINLPGEHFVLIEEHVKVAVMRAAT